ncbi:hypothetical protein AVEN_56575-1 [Araneus ventricosus]|uniref:Uncharacterized protein n=1 Tax=Araneus ventricosus TaxID=182803 RepID=A0A4Y2K5P8_ARAVE|nr:hypothetical protein AVEN_56575-1 [Araneus ventricosus]
MLTSDPMPPRSENSATSFNIYHLVSISERKTPSRDRFANARDRFAMSNPVGCNSHRLAMLLVDLATFLVQRTGNWRRWLRANPSRGAPRVHAGVGGINANELSGE